MKNQSKYTETLEKYLGEVDKEISFSKKYERLFMLKNWIEWLNDNNQISNTFYKNFTKKIEDSLDLSLNIKANIKTVEKTSDVNSLSNKFVKFFTFSFLIILFVLLFINFNLYRKLYSLSNLSIDTKSRILPFKGTISEPDGKPLQSKRDIIFRLYDAAVAGKILYTGSCIGAKGIIPDYNGVFNVRIGADCQMKPLAESIFDSNQSVYLGVTIGSGKELAPRYQIFTANYARDAAKLEGMSVGTDKSSLPYINDKGQIKLDVENPSLFSTDGTFNIEGQRILLKANNPIGGDIMLQPATGANVLINSGRLGIGTLKPTNLLSVSANNPNSSVASIRNITNIDSFDTGVLGLYLGSSSETESSSFIDFFAGATEQSSGDKVGSIRLNKNGVIYETSGADFAEYVALFDKSDVQSGSIISLSTKGAHASLPNEKIIGAVTNNAGFIGNKLTSKQSAVLIGFVGQIEILFSTISGEIVTGDRVGASKVPGYGAKVESDDFSVGYALTSSSSIGLSSGLCPQKYRSFTDPDGKVIECGRLLIFIYQD